MGDLYEGDHRCAQPSAAVLEPGAVWRCDDCGRLWVLSRDGDYWLRMGDRAARRWLRRHHFDDPPRPEPRPDLL